MTPTGPARSDWYVRCSETRSHLMADNIASTIVKHITSLINRLIRFVSAASKSKLQGA
jgi:hypothetical protein